MHVQYSWWAFLFEQMLLKNFIENFIAEQRPSMENFTHKRHLFQKAKKSEHKQTIKEGLEWMLEFSLSYTLWCYLHAL